MSEKSERATDYKLRKSKEKGLVSKSNELTQALANLLLVGVGLLLLPQLASQMLRCCSYLLQFSNHSFHDLSRIKTLLFSLILSLATYALLACLAISFSSIIQTGFVRSIHSLKPTWQRLHPRKKLQQWLSSQTLVEIVRIIIKLALLCFLIFTLVKNSSQFLNLSFYPPYQVVIHVKRSFFNWLIFICFVLFILGLLDYIYARKKFLSEQRMTKQEVREEYRQREGDPKIKNKIKQLQLKLRSKINSFSQVKTADFVITNPSHLAIALKYRQQEMLAPKVICKALGEQVYLVKKIARSHQIPVIEDKQLARALFAKVALNQTITPEFFAAIAALYQKIYWKKG